MTENRERRITFGGLEFYFVEQLDEIAPYYDTLSEPEKNVKKSRLKLLSMLSQLKSRNLPLAKYVFLECGPLLGALKNKDLKSYLPKRGRKNERVMPIKAIMELLQCSRRTAMDYQLAEKIEDQKEDVIRALLNSIASFNATQHDTVSKSAQPTEAKP
jgi:hypothetical protein